ncbi:MAG: hypothetical protein LAT81_14260 [Oceanicaulis sp.]|nr:hypothetical protein [Oceanicaulis sp.]
MIKEIEVDKILEKIMKERAWYKHVEIEPNAARSLKKRFHDGSLSLGLKLELLNRFKLLKIYHAK